MRVQIAVSEIKILNSLQIMKIGERFLLVRELCLAFFERNPYFFFYLFLFLRSHFLCVGFCKVYIRYRCQTQCAKSQNGDQCSHLGKTIDALISGDNF